MLYVEVKQMFNSVGHWGQDVKEKTKYNIRQRQEKLNLVYTLQNTMLH